METKSHRPHTRNKGHLKETAQTVQRGNRSQETPDEQYRTKETRGRAEHRDAETRKRVTRAPETKALRPRSRAQREQDRDTTGTRTRATRELGPGPWSRL